MVEDKAQLVTDYEAVFRKLPGLYLLLTPELTIVAGSEAYLKATGTSEEIFGQKLFDVFPDSPENAHEGVLALRSSLERVLRDGAADAMALQRYDLIHPDGSSEMRYWSPINTPVYDRSGKLGWILHRVSDVTAAAAADAQDARLAELESELIASGQRLAEVNESLRRSEARLRLALEVGRMAVWRWRVSQGGLLVTPELNVLLGFPEEHPTIFEEIQASMPPGDGESLWASAHAAVANGARFFECGFKHRRPDTGEMRSYHLRAELLTDEAGQTVEVLGILADITEQKNVERRQRVLMDELNHRVKNNLAVVQAMAARTFRGQGSDEALDSFVQRLSAFGRAHDVLTQEEWGGALVGDLVTSTFEAIGFDADRCKFSGPPVRLEPGVALSLGLALHELATNAIKHGALSTTSGMVEVSWRTAGPADAPEMILDWRETGGPPVSPPTRRGFGAQLLERIFPPHLGSIDMDFNRAGLTSRIKLKHI